MAIWAFTFRTLRQSLAKQFGLTQGGGVLIGDVSPNTPAAKAGLKSGDVVTEVNGQPVNAANQLQVQISQMAPGSPIKMKIWRDGKAQDFNVTLGELPEKAEQAEPGETSEGALEGVDVQNLTPDLAAAAQSAATAPRVLLLPKWILPARQRPLVSIGEW